MAESDHDPPSLIPWDNVHEVSDVQSKENQDQRKNSDEFECGQLELILSGSEEEIKPKNKKGTRKEDANVVHTSATPTPSMLQPLSQVDMAHQVLGRLAPKELMFCPFSAVSKYPYKYMRREHSEAVSQAYFANGQFRARGWTLYYIYTMLASPTKPLILLLAAEVEAFLFEISEKLDLELKFPRSHEEPGFLLEFHQERSPRPRYLGRLTTENTLEMMESQVLGPAFKGPGEADDLDHRSFDAFRRKMEAAIQAGRNKSKASKEKKKKARIIEKKGCCAQLKRTQCYLGIRPRWKALIDPHSIPGLSWSELQEAIKKHESARTKSQRIINTAKAVPHALYQNVVFVSVDVESYERHHKTVTEIGISTLDTNDIADLAPGEGGEAWMKMIRSRHFRIRENSHLINTDFISGCADKFEKEFGTSEWISIHEAPQVIASCFRPPFTKPNLIDSSANLSQAHQTDQDAASNNLSSDKTSTGHEDPTSDRKIVLVGHDIKSDVEYLHNIGYDVNNLSNLLEAIDTVDLFRAMKHEQQGRNLGGVLLELGLTGWNLHNAGNDAAYTLQAMIGIAFTALDAKRDRRDAAEAARASRLEEAAKDATERVAEDWEEWNLADDDEGDGGAPRTVSKQDDMWVSKSDKGSSRVKQAEQLAKKKLEADAKDDEEAIRLTIVVGDDIGEDNPKEVEVVGANVANVNVQEVRESVMNWKGVEEAQDDGSPVSMGVHDLDHSIRVQSDASSPEGANTDEDDHSPVPDYVAERLAFFESLDVEDGGVKP